jgi:hypothetical protein
MHDPMPTMSPATSFHCSSLTTHHHPHPRLCRYTFRLAPGQVPLAVINGITMAPRHGVRVTVHARE